MARQSLLFDGASRSFDREGPGAVHAAPGDYPVREAWPITVAGIDDWQTFATKFRSFSSRANLQVRTPRLTGADSAGRRPATPNAWSEECLQLADMSPKANDQAFWLRLAEDWLRPAFSAAPRRLLQQNRPDPDATLFGRLRG
jgi:hypothetical protein